MFARYLLYQVPGWLIVIGALLLLRDTLGLSAAASAGIFGLWVVKDLVLFPFLRHAYETDPRTVVERLVGEPGTAVAEINPTGYVRVRGELWRAELDAGEPSVAPGRPIRVVGVRESTLLIVARTGSARD